jgi:4-diphosphocytidyl-2-C-methyl-D-erythritol kinase
VSSHRSVLLAAPAKVNLFLRVLDRRSDGFHEIETLFQAIDMYDEVEVALTDSGVTLDVAGADLGPTEENLAYRAARAVLSDTGAEQGVHVRLKKHVPAGAGLGGGSSDAASVLRAANVLLGSPLPQSRLGELGASLGSDVPFFLGPSPLSIGRGRGERLLPLPPIPPLHLAVVLPPVHVATGPAYSALSRAREAIGASAAEGRRMGERPRSWADIAAFAHNDFEEVVPVRHPEVARSLEALRRAAGGFSLLSGSGAACFSVFESRPAATLAAEQLAHSLGWPALACTTLDRFPEAVVHP